MLERGQFFPGQPGAQGCPLAHYRPRQRARAVSDYVRALTAPGDLVVDLFCQGPRFVRETVEIGRRALGCSINPLLLLSARLGLRPLDRQALSSAFTLLADSLKGNSPLQSHLLSLYRSACPVCQTPGVADWFAWDRDLGYPFEKGVRCGECGGVQVGPADGDDIASARSFAPRGLAYYYALDRAAPPGHPARERAAELVDCYTPRNLSALMDLNRRLEGLKVAPEVKAALMAVLLDSFDRGSKLYPYGEDRRRPRTLRIPVRYLERNVWFSFEDGLADLKSAESRPAIPEAEDARLLVEGESGGYALVARAARDVQRVIPAMSVALALVDPPRPDGVFWALSALWATWLWDSTEAHAMRPFLRRRRFDWDWHWRALRGALTVVGSRLTADGSLVTLFETSDDALLESVCLAASSAGYDLRGWGYTPEVGYHLLWRWEGARPARPIDAPVLERRMVTGAEQATEQALHQRGEPTPESLLHAGVYTSLVKESLFACVARLDDDVSAMAFAADAADRGFSGAPIAELRQEGTDVLWWLHRAQGVTNTLADRTETAARRLLGERVAWPENDLVNAVYARFPDVLTPDLTLVHVCIASYGIRDDGEICLRPEDDPQRRQREVDQIRDGLLAMGERLGYRTVEDGVWDVRWLEEGRETYVFVISSTATVAPYLLDTELSAVEAQRCLVVPGGRARLIDLKLRRDPRLTAAVREGGWRFIKFRHLRRLMAEKDLDRYAFKTVVGLDPIVEQEGAQIPLF